MFDHIPVNFSFKPVSVTVEMSAFGFVIRDPVPGVGLNISPDDGGHASLSPFETNVMDAELMQYRSPP